MKAPTPAQVPVMIAVPAGMVVPIPLSATRVFSYLTSLSHPGLVELTLTHATQNLTRVPNQIAVEFLFLPHLTVNPYSNLLGPFIHITEYLGGDKDRPKWSEFVKGFGEEELSTSLIWKLMHAAREIVATGIAEDV